MATFLEIRERVLKAAQSQDDDMAAQLVVETIAEIVDRSGFPQKQASVAVVAGTKAYDVSADWLITDFVDVAYLSSANAAGTVVKPMEPIDASEMRRWHILGSTGQARLYAFRQPDTVEIYPTPALSTDVLTLVYVYLPAALSADTDVPDEAVPARWTQMIVDGAAAKLATVEEADADLVGLLAARFETTLGQYVQAVQDRYGVTAKRAMVGASGRLRQPATRGEQ